MPPKPRTTKVRECRRWGRRGSLSRQGEPPNAHRLCKFQRRAKNSTAKQAIPATVYALTTQTDTDDGDQPPRFGSGNQEVGRQVHDLAYLLPVMPFEPKDIPTLIPYHLTAHAWPAAMVSAAVR